MSGGSPRRDFDNTAGSTHNLVVGLVPRGARVLEFGCATGYMSGVLKERLGCRVTGIELSPEAAALAQECCDRVVAADAETLDVERVFGDERFDAIIFADVLEHLRDPGIVLQRIRALLAEGGAVVASIPNVAHGSVRLALLGGEFRYRDAGLLDRTHLRFFTRETVQDLFEGSGYAITHWRHRRLGIEESEVGPPVRPVPEPVRLWLGADREATIYQFVVRAAPSDSAGTICQLRAELRELRAAGQWAERAQRAGRELATVVRSGESFVLIDEDRIRADLGPAARAVPFPERGGQYGGPPPDDAVAIEEIERLRRAGAMFAVIAWPAFWWLDFYPEFGRHLQSRYRRVLDTERLVVYDLRSSLDSCP